MSGSTKSVRLSYKPVLPALRPLSPANISDTPRGIKPPSRLGDPNRYSHDYEVNRSLFAPRKKIKNIIPPIDGAQPEQKVQPPPKPSDISLLEDLNQRIPDIKPDEDGAYDPDDAFRISPVLDRILCVTSSWQKEQIIEYSKFQIVDQIQNKLFALIDINDFLLRTIICRILLCFAPDSNSELLLPIARIFYKLSCDQSNDPFFVEENIDDLLFNLIENSPFEAKVYAAGTLKNITGYDAMRNKLVNSKLLPLTIDILSVPDADETLKLQMIGAIRQMSRNQEFTQKLAQTSVLSDVGSDNLLLNEVLRTVALIKDLPTNEKIKILSLIPKSSITDEEHLRIVAKAFMNISTGIENHKETAEAANFLLQHSKEYPEILIVILNSISACCNEEANLVLFEGNQIIINVLEDEGSDISLARAAHSIVSKFKTPEFIELSQKYADLLK